MIYIILRSTYTVAELGFYEGGGIDIYDMRGKKGEYAGRGCPPSHSENKNIF